jgi:hypothetical protein
MPLNRTPELEFMLIPFSLIGLTISVQRG